MLALSVLPGWCELVQPAVAQQPVQQALRVRRALGVALAAMLAGQRAVVQPAAAVRPLRVPAQPVVRPVRQPQTLPAVRQPAPAA